MPKRKMMIDVAIFFRQSIIEKYAPLFRLGSDGRWDLPEREPAPASQEAINKARPAKVSP
jgi:hypothetical protein